MTENVSLAESVNPASMNTVAGETANPSTPEQPTPTAAEQQIARQRRLWGLGGGLLLAVFVGFLVVALWRQQVSEQRAAGVAPDFSFTTFEGQSINLADLKGKGVVVNFWASWCNPCREEAALLEKAWQREQGQGIVFLGLDYLDQEHPAKEYLAEFKISYPSGSDIQSTAARRYGIQGVPETFFIKPTGEIASIAIGPLISEEDLQQRLDAIRPK